ncbi:DUF5958 family protein [Streptomyces sp. NPDC086554]|uniref:DUF5958 family protein n=1 Tax=Streptomyces sp. NPDC086554 TaxID=3154864 RepID=UPI0034215255
MSQGLDAAEGIRRSGLRPTHTPSVLVGRGRIDEQLGKVAELTPRHERIKAFRLLIHILGLADARRRERFCADGCSHEWHQGRHADGIAGATMSCASDIQVVARPDQDARNGDV